jgi:hypothetical protein
MIIVPNIVYPGIGQTSYLCYRTSHKVTRDAPEGFVTRQQFSINALPLLQQAWVPLYSSRFAVTGGFFCKIPLQIL